jgi:hypothetical protein
MDERRRRHAPATPWALTAFGWRRFLVPEALLVLAPRRATTLA